MTWTMPATAVTGNTLTAAFWNAQVRDNMLETGPATAQAGGDIVYADAANSMGSRLAHSGQSRFLVSDASSGLVWRQPAASTNFADASTSNTDTHTSYSASWNDTNFPSVTITTGIRAIVVVQADLSNSSAGNNVFITYSISGATTAAAGTVAPGRYESGNANDASTIRAGDFRTVTAGSNTFQMEARVSGGSGTIQNPRILVTPY